MIQVGKDNVDISDHARNIGAILDSNLSMVPQVNSVVKSCYMKLRQIGQIRPYLTEDVTATLVGLCKYTANWITGCLNS